MSSALDRVWAMMLAVRTCMFVTHGAEILHARPMAAIPDRAAGAVWFFTSGSSAKPDDLRDDKRTCLIFHQAGGNVFLSVSGRTRQSRDVALMRRKWDREAALWFPGGPADPDVLLLHFRPENAQYWARPGDFDSVAREVRAARAQGRAPDIGENENVIF